MEGEVAPHVRVGGPLTKLIPLGWCPMRKKSPKKSASKPAGQAARRRVKEWHGIPDPKDRGKSTLQVQVPIDATAQELAEAEQHVKALEANQQIAREAGQLPPGATHQVESDALGRKRLVRKRYSAL